MKVNNNFLQSKYWRKVKENLGNKTFDAGEIWFQTTPLPIVNKNIGYIPRPRLEDINWKNLYEEGKKAGCVFISIDPDNLKSENPTIKSKLKTSLGKPTHLQENVILDISKSEEELLLGMKQKHRYNIKIAQKKGVEVKIGKDSKMLDEFLSLYQETVDRQNYFGRSSDYIKTVWNTLQTEVSEKPLALIITAYLEGKPLSSWMLFLFEDTIYYPYGGSSSESKNVMATYLLVWELIKWGKKNGYTKLDLWGIETKSDDGFSRFKLGFGGNHIVYSDTIDLVIDENLYSVLKIGLSLREQFKFLMKWF
jgi:lipid II:glycine glycyltransferase (peptidoglycan interpeptide bridge formation enzyme)